MCIKFIGEGDLKKKRNTWLSWHAFFLIIFVAISKKKNETHWQLRFWFQSLKDTAKLFHCFIKKQYTLISNWNSKKKHINYLIKRFIAHKFEQKMQKIRILVKKKWFPKNMKFSLKIKSKQSHQPAINNTFVCLFVPIYSKIIVFFFVRFESSVQLKIPRWKNTNARIFPFIFIVSCQMPLSCQSWKNKFKRPRLHNITTKKLLQMCWYGASKK